MPLVTGPRLFGNSDTDVIVLDQDRWSFNDGESGIIGDSIGTAWRTVASGVNAIVTTGTVGNRCKIRGMYAEIISSAPTNDFSQAHGGSVPSVGQNRLSRIVVRLNLTTWEAQVVAIGGTATTPGLEVAPALTRNSNFYDMPMCMVRQRGTSPIIQSDIIDQRRWVIRRLVGMDATELTDEPVGTEMRFNRTTRLRRLSSETTATWGTTDNLSIFAVGSAIFAPTVHNTVVTNYQVQAGTFVGTANSQGLLVVPFTVPFPGGILTVNLTNGDMLNVPILTYGLTDSNLNGFTVRATLPDATNYGGLFRVNYIAIGW